MGKRADCTTWWVAVAPIKLDEMGPDGVAGRPEVFANLQCWSRQRHLLSIVFELGIVLCRSYPRRSQSDMVERLSHSVVGCKVFVSKLHGL